MNIPKLRFKEFNGYWQAKELADVSEIVGGGTPDTTNSSFWGGEVIWLTPSEIKNKYTNNSIRKITELGLKNSSAKLLPEGSLIFTSRATVGEVSISTLKLCTNQGFLSLIINKDNYNQFVYYWILNNKKAFIRKASGSTFLEISKTDMKKVSGSFPNIKEQEKIADFLTAVDEKITNLEEKKAAFEKYKKGVMQAIFSQKTRFKKTGGTNYPDWISTSLNEILKDRHERNIDNTVTEVLSVAKNAGVINQIEHLGRSFASKNIDNYKIIRPNDVVYTKSPTSDFPFGIVKQNKLKRTGVVSALYGVYKPSNEYLGTILDYYFKSWQNTFNYLNPIVQKGAKNTINISDNNFLNGPEILLPLELDEQKMIAEFINANDEKLELSSKELEEARKFKKSLLQQMFV